MNRLHTNIAFALSVVLGLALASGCSRREPLPGDSVAPNGAVAVAPPPATASGIASAAAREPLGAVESRLFPPELVMEHQSELALDDKQRTTIMNEVEHAQTEMTRIRWDLERDREALVKLLDAEPIDETAVSAAAKRLTDAEARVKAVHLTMLVRVKNALTAPQKARLRQLRK
jgi:Spy/CpxP family protein refolding chaperone